MYNFKQILASAFDVVHDNIFHQMKKESEISCSNRYYQTNIDMLGILGLTSKK